MFSTFSAKSSLRIPQSLAVVAPLQILSMTSWSQFLLLSTFLLSSLDIKIILPTETNEKNEKPKSLAHFKVVCFLLLFQKNK